jgi:hypothetical protein
MGADQVSGYEVVQLGLGDVQFAQDNGGSDHLFLSHDKSIAHSRTLALLEPSGYNPTVRL